MTEPPDLVPLTLVPVEVFGESCDCHINAGHDDADHDCRNGCKSPCPGWIYGLSDAVQGWSDCNRADGRIYRVEDHPGHREPGDTVTVYVARGDLVWFRRRFGERHDGRIVIDAPNPPALLS